MQCTQYCTRPKVLDLQLRRTTSAAHNSTNHNCFEVTRSKGMKASFGTDNSTTRVNDLVTRLSSPPWTQVLTGSMDTTNASIFTKTRNLGSSVSIDSSSLGRKPCCLLACSGSVATVKVPELAVRLSQYFEVLIVCTQNAMFFLHRAEAYNPAAWQQFIAIGGMDLVLEDKDEWEMWNKIGHDILHIDLRRWADVLVVAPASANLIAKASVGICDNLVLSLLRAWELRKRPCLFCPAMNTVMWEHPSTQPALTTLQSWGWKVVGPVEKMLACKEVGSGAMAHVDDIVHATRRALEPLNNIAPYLVDDDDIAAAVSNKTMLELSSLENIKNTNIPYQSYLEKKEQLDSAEVQRAAQLQKEQLETQEKLTRMSFNFKMVVVPAILLIWGTFHQLQERLEQVSKSGPTVITLGSGSVLPPSISREASDHI